MHNTEILYGVLEILPKFANLTKFIKTYLMHRNFNGTKKILNKKIYKKNKNSGLHYCISFTLHHKYIIQF